MTHLSNCSFLRATRSARAGIGVFASVVAAATLPTACSDDDADIVGIDGVGGAGGSGGAAGMGGGGMGGSGGTPGTAGMGGGGMAGSGMGGSGMSTGGMAGSGGSGMKVVGPTGSVEVLSADASLVTPTTAAIRGDQVFVTVAQFDDLFGGTTPDPFVAVSVPLAGGELGASIALPDNYFPEGITAAEDGTLYIGSLTTGAIQSVAADSTTAEEFVAAGAIAERGVVGLTVDEERSILWFCDSSLTGGGALVGVSTAAKTEGIEVVRHALPDGPGSASGDAGVGADAGAGLDAGAVLDAGADAGTPANTVRAAFCNDAIVTPQGDVLISDSFGGRLFRILSANALIANSAELWSTAPQLAPADPAGFGVNGLDMVGDQLVFANGGLFVMDPSSPDSAQAILLDAQFLGTPDGLATVPGSADEIVVVDNANPGRILKVTLDLN